MVKRNTIQKQLIMEATGALTGHPTAEDVYNYIKVKYPDISKGTVYRNLNTLAEDGLLRKITMPYGADRFDKILMRHHHVCCVRCGKFCDVPLATVTVNMDLVAESTGFRLTEGTVVLEGLCPECANKQDI